MNLSDFIDFITAALPWIGISLFILVFMMKEESEKKGVQIPDFIKLLNWFPSVCFMVLAILDMSQGKQSSGTVWLVLAVINLVTGRKSDGQE